MSETEVADRSGKIIQVDKQAEIMLGQRSGAGVEGGLYGGLGEVSVCISYRHKYAI